MVDSAANTCVSGREGTQNGREHRRNLAVRLQSAAILTILVASAMIVSPMSSRSVAAAPIVMTIGTTEHQDTFNPFSMMSGVSWMIAWEMYEVLVTHDPVTQAPRPMLAESWETSPDGKVWTFHLATNSLWHDNTPVTSEDVNWTFNLILQHPRECGLFTGYVKNVTDVRALDAYTVRFTTEVPKATMLTMNVPILPKHLWSAVPLNQIGQIDLWNTKYFPNGPVGSGPMILHSFDKTLGDIWMYKWDKYHNGTINVDQVLYKMFSSEDAMMNALYSGSIDLAMQVPSSLWDTTISRPGIVGQVADQLDMHHMGFNCASPTVRFAKDSRGHALFPKASTNTETWNTSVRRACAMAINKTEIVNEILKNLADEGDTIIPPITPFWKWNVPDADKIKFDLDAANATLEAAGYVDEDHDGIRENTTSHVKLDLKFYYPSGYAADELAAQKIASWLSIIGIHAPANLVSETVLFGYQYDMSYDMFMWSWWPELDPSFILSVLTSGEIADDNQDYAAWSDTFFSNPTYDALFQQQITAVNPSQRQTIVHDMQKIQYHDCPYIILWYPYSLFAYRTDRFTNFPDFSVETGATPEDFFFFMEVTPLTGNQPPMFDSPLNAAYQAIVNTTQTFAVQVSDVDSDKLWVNWTFGDGGSVAQVVDAGASGTPTEMSVSHTYTTLSPPAGFTLTCSLADGHSGHEKQSVATVSVIERPDQSPVFSSPVISSPYLTAYNDTPVTWFVNASDHESGGASGFGLRFTWVWDDGQITVSNHRPTTNDTDVMDSQTHSWSVPGTYNVEVFIWDGVVSSTHNVSAGAVSYVVKQNTPPSVPSPSISGSEGTWVECAASSTDADPDPLRFTWVWDDGTFNVTNHAANAGNQQTSVVNHLWPVTGSPATYPVTVWVDDLTDYFGHNVSWSGLASISPAGSNVPPTALVIVPPSHGYINTNLQIETSARDTDGDALWFYMEFGDGGSAAAGLPAGIATRQYMNFTHSYSAPGTYEIRLYVNDSTGPASHNCTTTSNIIVTENVPPTVSLPSTLTAGYNVTFKVTPTQCTDADGDTLEVWYDWGDGSIMTRGDPAHYYAATHAYSTLGDMTLTVYVDDGTGLAGHNVTATAALKVSEANLKPEVVGVINKNPSKTSYLPEEIITFTIVVRDYEGDNLTLRIEFGDGETQVVSIVGLPEHAAYTNITKNVTHAYAAARTERYSFNATVEDGKDHSNMVWSKGTTYVQVSEKKPSKGFPLSLVAGIAILVVLSLVAMAFLLKRRRKDEGNQEEGSSSPAEDAPPPPAA